jgi:DNA-binding NarL/FixJ family response regulator
VADSTALSVVLQHGNRLVRDLLAGHLTGEPGIVIAGTAASGPELVRLCKVRRPVVAVFEADAPRWSNERLVMLLRQTGRQMRMVGVHDALTAAYVIRAYAAGVSALVSYSAGLDALCEAVKTPSLPVEMAREARSDGQALTDRELQVLYLISAGFTPRQVSTELGISQHTVEHHKKQIFAKLDVHSQAQAAASAVRLGLHPPPSVILRRQNAGTPNRRQSVSVTLSGSAGRLGDRIRKILSENRIPVVDEGARLRPVTEDGSLITVLVDPPQSELPSQDGMHVFVDSREPRQAQVTRALVSGIATVPASRVEELLVPAVRAAAQGYVLANSAYVRALSGASRDDFTDGWRRWELTLTPREKEILASISHGHATKQTARMLGISIRTVENLQSNLFKKLRVHSRAAALVAAHNLGLLDERQ